MDRFFSKLDLRDIKIDPEKSRFSPDEDDVIELAPPAEGDQETKPEPENPAYEPIVATPVWTDDDEVIESEDSGNRREADTVSTPEVHRHVNDASDVLKVSSKSRPSAVAGAIAGVVREIGRAEVQAIGAGATNQAVKAVAIARDYLHETGIDAVCLPAFIDITIDNEDRTAIRLVIEPR